MKEMVGQKPGGVGIYIYIYTNKKSGASEFLKQIHDSSKDIALVKFS